MSIPERVVRSAVAITGGLAREFGEVVIPAPIRRTRLYTSLVDSSLRFLLEQVGQVEGAWPESEKLPDDFLLRRTAGNGLEAIGLLTFHASPVWVMAAVADVSGAGRQLIREISATLQKEGALETGTSFETAEQVLDGLERTSARVAEAVNTPPLNVEQLRSELSAIRRDAVSAVPSSEDVWSTWRALEREAAAQGRPVWELSSVMALAAVRTAAVATGGSLLAHYRDTLGEIHKTGYGKYLARELSPYLKTAVRQFSPKRRTLTQRLLRG